MKDKLPEVGTDCLCFSNFAPCGDLYYVAATWAGDDFYYQDTEDGMVEGVTHWMLLPEPPESDS